MKFPTTPAPARMLAVAVLAATALYGAGFVDDHEDGILTGWTPYGGRAWAEVNGAATPSASSAQGGFLVHNHPARPEGVLTVRLTADQWNGAKGGVVFRWTSPTSFYFIAVQPGNQWSSFLRFCKNTTNAALGTVIASNFTVGNTFTLRIEMSQSRFKFYIDDVFQGEANDPDHSYGQVGYANSSNWGDYLDFEGISWIEEELNHQPADILLSRHTVEDGRPVGTVVGILSAVDPDEDDRHDFTLVSGPGDDDNSRFTIADDTLRTGDIFDFTAQSLYHIRVRTTDGGSLSYVKSIVIRIIERENYGEWPFSQRIFFNTTGSGADIAADVTEFPVLIRLSGASFDFSLAQPQGQDIRFEDPDGTPLAYEIERWDAAAREAAVWVTVPRITGNSTADYITLYFGREDAVDKSHPGGAFEVHNGFAGVWHLDEKSAGAGTAQLYRDATDHGNHGTDQVSTESVEGIIGRGESFDGSTDHIVIPGVTSADLDALTLSAWIRPQGTGAWADVISKGENSAWNGGFALRLSDTDQLAFTLNNGGKQELYGAETALEAAGQSWYLVTGTYDGKEMRIYINGVEVKRVGTLSGRVMGTPVSLTLGRDAEGSGRWYRGIIDEVRLADVARDPSWIRLCFANQRAHQTLISLGPVIAALAAPDNLSAGAAGEAIVLTWRDRADTEAGFEIFFGAAPEDLALIARVPANAESFTHTPGGCEASGYYGVRAYNDTARSALVVLSGKAYPQPCIPTGLTATALSETEIGLVWDGTAFAYVLEARKGSGPWATVFRGSEKRYVHTGLTCFTAYAYRVQGVTPDSAASDFTGIVEASTNYCSIHNPTGLTADNTDPNHIQLTWTDNADNEVGYRVFRREGDAPFREIEDFLPPNTAAYTDRDIGCGRRYAYYVQSYGLVAVSNPSEVVTIDAPFCGKGKSSSEMISISGMVLDGARRPVTGIRPFLVRLYDNAQGDGDPLYEELFDSVTVKNGFFTLALGMTRDIVLTIRNFASLHYDILVEGISLYDDRVRPLTASPYTINSSFNLQGMGSPNGIVPAPVGAFFVDTLNRMLYVKVGAASDEWLLVSP